MREINCPGCGQHAEAANDEELFKVARQHADQAHADQNMTDDQIRQIIRQNARDKK
jgi:predicted small metal-binding protein